MRRNIALAMALVMTTFAMSSAGCIGRMALTGKVMEFNLSVTENKWGREVIYLVLYILPVYEFAAMVDLLIINSIEFHTGTNPLSGQERLAMNVIEAPNGARGESFVREDGTLVLDLTESDGTRHSLEVIQVGGGMELRDRDGTYLGHVGPDGRVFSRDGEVEIPRS